MNTTSAPHSEELTRLEILRAFKKHFAGDRKTNRSPFAEDRVVRYHTDVTAWDVPEIHRHVRETIQQQIRGIRAGRPSQVVILAGEPGMGKSHLLNSFRGDKQQDDGGYVLVCNANHWRVEEFEECLLDWTLDALVRPSPQGPHLLLGKIQEIAFQALGQILTRPGQFRQFQKRSGAGLLRRFFGKLFGSGHARVQKALEKRDVRIFGQLDFARFASYVCDKFLPEKGNPFHRYVLRVLLRYLFPEDRELVLHWLRRKNVQAQFVKKLGAEEAIDRHYKVLDTLKILISLFTPDVTRNLNPGAASPQDRVFFFAFDQIEGRAELFEREEDWFKFFAQLAELYNALPNVFILFTMTIKWRELLYPKMERQFQQRIHRDQKLVLREIEADEVLAVYRRRIDHWLGNGVESESVHKRLGDPRCRYLPFAQEEVLEMSRQKTLREFLDQVDRQFRGQMLEVTVEDPRFEYLVMFNELRQNEADARPFDYTDDHLAHVEELLYRSGGVLAGAYDMTFGGLEKIETADGLPALRLEFRRDDRWVRAFLVRLPFRYNQKLPGCLDLLANKQRSRYALWLLRPDRIDRSLEEYKPGQIFTRELPLSTETSLQAMLHLLNKRDQFRPRVWAEAEQVLREEFKLTYLGELFQEASEDLEGKQREDGEPIREVLAVQPVQEDRHE